MVRVAHSGRSVGDYFLTLLAAIGVILLIAVVIATYFYMQTPVCVDTCSVSSCSGAEYIECAVQPDGCLAPVSLGTVLGQCGAECLTDAHCGDSDASTVDVVCSSENRCLVPASLAQLPSSSCT